MPSVRSCLPAFCAYCIVDIYYSILSNLHILY
uniref:Uncharacterized protein n=1 Tax=Arundo donax TaxID=35708 RepID=A0A0A9GRB3_ARUDO